MTKKTGKVFGYIITLYYWKMLRCKKAMLLERERETFIREIRCETPASHPAVKVVLYAGKSFENLL